MRQWTVGTWRTRQLNRRAWGLAWPLLKESGVSSLPTQHTPWRVAWDFWHNTPSQSHCWLRHQHSAFYVWTLRTFFGAFLPLPLILPTHPALSVLCLHSLITGKLLIQPCITLALMVWKKTSVNILLPCLSPSSSCCISMWPSNIYL